MHGGIGLYLISSDDVYTGTEGMYFTGTEGMYFTGTY